jgi:DMSO/TMAO reductase YedYZ molybdopterin-dependent catalytic subunit
LGHFEQEPEHPGAAVRTTAPVTRENVPHNAETPLSLLSEPLVPQGAFYIRNHGEEPDLDIDAWRCVVDGAVERPLALSWPQISALSSVTRRVTLECAGNGRSHMAQPAEGTPWGYGAVGTADFTGAPLGSVLEQAGPSREAVDILFEGADETRPSENQAIPFQRSLPLDVALHGDCLLAWSMNGEPLRRAHGYPLRLVVPGWYGMASVKWLVRITALTDGFAGYYQRERYVFSGEAGMPEGAPVTCQRIRAVIAHPQDGATIPPAPIRLAGAAWSGEAAVARVELSVDEGRSWIDAELEPAEPGAACTWSLIWHPPGTGACTILARATDAHGNRQPLQASWNRYGYANNAAQRVRVTVTG